MARPVAEGLLYFSLDVNFFSDKKIKILKSRYGADGITLYIYLLCEIYKSGYYLVADDDFEFIISDDLNMDSNKVKQIMNFLFERSLLDGKLFESDKVLTSTGIQKMFQKGVATRARKKPIMAERFWLLSEEKTETFIKVYPNSDKSEINDSYSEINSDKSEINDIKKSKENKRKEIKEESEEISQAKYSPDSFERQCVDYLSEKLLQELPGSKVPKTDKEFDKWCSYIELLVKKDNRTQADIRKCLEFAVTDPFWRTNIRSTFKFREKYDTLFLQMQSKGEKPKSSEAPRNTGTKFNNFNQRKYDYDALESQLLKPR